MKKEKTFRIKNTTKKELEKHFNIPISNKEFRVVKYLALDSGNALFDPYKDDGEKIVKVPDVEASLSFLGVSAII